MQFSLFSDTEYSFQTLGCLFCFSQRTKKKLPFKNFSQPALNSLISFLKKLFVYGGVGGWFGFQPAKSTDISLMDWEVQQLLAQLTHGKLKAILVPIKWLLTFMRALMMFAQKGKWLFLLDGGLIVCENCRHSAGYL